MKYDTREQANYVAAKSHGYVLRVGKKYEVVGYAEYMGNRRANNYELRS